MHGAPIPCPSGKASLLIVCAHAWEAAPFIAAGELRGEQRGFLPFPTYSSSNDAGVSLILTGNGRARACLAVGCWLSHALRDGGDNAGAHLLAPPIVVANYGTAGAYVDSWERGTSLLINKVGGPAAAALFPERCLVWSGPEGECRTVDSPQRIIEDDDRARQRRPVFDMEAFGVAEAVTVFLSSSHLVIGKFVIDLIGPGGDQTLDWKALTSQRQAEYGQKCLEFLAHAKAQREHIFGSLRRSQSVEVQDFVASCLTEIALRLSLTVSQQRELAQMLRATGAGMRDESEAVRMRAELGALLSGQDKPSSKTEAKLLLSRLQDLLRQRPGW